MLLKIIVNQSNEDNNNLREIKGWASRASAQFGETFMARGALTRCYAYAILYLLQSKTSSSTYSGANVTSIPEECAFSFTITCPFIRHMSSEVR